MHARASFEGGVFDSGIEGGRASAELEPGLSGVRARLPDGREYSIAWREARLEQGGASGRMVFVRGAGADPTFFCEAPGFVDALAEAGGSTLAPAVEELRGRAKARSRQSLGGWGLLLAVLVAFGFAVPPSYRWLVDRAVDQVPLSVDAKLGDLASVELAGQGPPIDNPKVTGFAQEVVDRLVAALPPEQQAHSFKITVVENPNVNAMALPGGRMVLFSGLIKRADNADMVAGVLAHEVAHVTERHGLRHLLRSVGIVVVLQALVGDPSGLIGVLTQGAALAVLTDYSRDQESNADEVGAALAARAGFNPEGLPAFFDELSRLDVGEVPEALQWMSSHPSHEERSASLREGNAALEIAAAPPLKHSLAEAKAALTE
jgi:Zn-dependent protease with chaperone function